MGKTVKSRLLPCPFCRCPDIDIYRPVPTLPVQAGMVVVVRCTQCSCTKRVTTKYLEQALHEWNFREGVLYALMNTKIPQERRHPYRTVKD